MATSVVSRSFKGLVLGRTLLNRSVLPISVSLGHKKCLQLSPVPEKRIYGPPEERGISGPSHWKTERVVSLFLVPVIPVALLYPNPLSDTLFSAAVVLHSHWGLSAAAKDYIHGETLPGIIRPTILVFSILAFGSLCYLNYADIGLGKAVHLLFSQL